MAAPGLRGATALPASAVAPVLVRCAGAPAADAGGRAEPASRPGTSLPSPNSARNWSMDAVRSSGLTASAWSMAARKPGL